MGKIYIELEDAEPLVEFHKKRISDNLEKISLLQSDINKSKLLLEKMESLEEEKDDDTEDVEMSYKAKSAGAALAAYQVIIAAEEGTKITANYINKRSNHHLTKEQAKGILKKIYNSTYLFCANAKLLDKRAEGKYYRNGYEAGVYENNLLQVVKEKLHTNSLIDLMEEENGIDKFNEISR